MKTIQKYKNQKYIFSFSLLQKLVVTSSSTTYRRRVNGVSFMRCFANNWIKQNLGRQIQKILLHVRNARESLSIT